jgi:hypothetical protein
MLSTHQGPDGAAVVAMEHLAGQRKPAMSVIIVTPDSYATIRNLVDSMRAQTVRDALELVIVAPNAAVLKDETANLDCFCSWRIVELSNMRSVPGAKAAGIRCATAPIVVMTEDHSLPEPAWARALIDAHAQGWAAVGPAVCNGNPETLTSWADFIIGYGPWINPLTAGEVDDLPGHNSSYKRDLLLEYQERLEEVLAAESILHQELRARGHRLYLEPAAITFHSNFTEPLRWTPYLYYSARLFASQRVYSWPLLRRAAYSGAACLIPLVRLRRLMPPIRRSRPDLMPRVLAPLLFALIVDAAGQWLGYTFGAGQAAEKLARLEFHRSGVPTDASRPLRG